METGYPWSYLPLSHEIYLLRAKSRNFPHNGPYHSSWFTALVLHVQSTWSFFDVTQVVLPRSQSNISTHYSLMYRTAEWPLDLSQCIHLAISTGTLSWVLINNLLHSIPLKAAVLIGNLLLSFLLNLLRSFPLQTCEGLTFISLYRGTNPSLNASLPSGAPNTPLYNFVPYENYYSYGPGGWERRTDSFTSFNSFIPPWIATPYPPRDSSNGVRWPWLHPSDYPPAPSELSLHHLLSGESGHNILIFDLSSPKFDPMIYLGSNTFERLSEKYKKEPATRPGSNHLRIECDLVPEWPIRVDIHPEYIRGQSPPPGAHTPLITLGDVLSNIYSHFSQRIRHEDWANLNLQDQIAVTKAYTARCTALGSAETIERSHGVRRIDYTCGKVWFKRLTRVGDGTKVLKLHLDKYWGRKGWKEGNLILIGFELGVDFALRM